MDYPQDRKEFNITFTSLHLSFSSSLNETPQTSHLYQWSPSPLLLSPRSLGSDQRPQAFLLLCPPAHWTQQVAPLAPLLTAFVLPP